MQVGLHFNVMHNAIVDAKQRLDMDYLQSALQSKNEF